MATLWRALALAWLGGVASPALMDEVGAVGTTVECVAADETPASEVALRLAAFEEEPQAAATDAAELPRS